MSSLTIASALPLVRGVYGRADVPELPLSACMGERLRDVGAAVVGHHPPDDDAVGIEERERPVEEPCRGPAALVGQLLHVGQSGVIVDGDVDDVPADRA